jgi:hypothetical protein
MPDKADIKKLVAGLAAPATEAPKKIVKMLPKKSAKKK